MKNILLFVIFISVSFQLTAQNRMSSTLENDVNQYPKDWQEILVVGSERVDAMQFEALHRNEFATREEFTVAFLKELKKQSNFQTDWLSELDYYDLNFEIIHRFWSVNIVAIKAPAKTIKYLNKHPDVYWMEEISERPIEWVKPVSMTPNNQKIPFGREPGITAVKGDKLWKKGYTGKGRKLLTFDTGVWPNHPMFRGQFLGNHLPLSQSWYGYDSYFPGDKSNSHGTHVTGTCIGMDRSVADTIGLAFNAYFMATDPIVQSLADIKTAFEIMKGYEWALNPDGDINTTNDMPDVINNSWGRPYGVDDSVACDGWVNDLFVNVEIAGIISIHSAGNEGPGPSTIGYPAVSNASVVNNFSIGAVNGNVTSFPIASFSSRGPTVCGGTGSLLIKPEVVAPGVNVRSSVRNPDGTYGFANYQGTSMAAPHVSGVSLLLREAFPQASATEIKESLYYTATDLGVAGEDNTYGMGMIDALAAYNYLKLIYTPVVPKIDTMDLNCTGFNIKPFEAVCDLTTITAFFKNYRSMPSGEITFKYTFGHESGYVLQATAGGFFNQIDSYELDFSNNFTVQPGWNEFYLRMQYSMLYPEEDTVNSMGYLKFWVIPQQPLPYQENFDTSHVFESSLYVGNPDESTTWDTMTVETKNGLDNVATMQFARYSPRNYQHDYLQTPNFELSNPEHVWLTFDLSYQLKFNGFKDSLMVFVSTDCGDTWSAPLYAKGPDSLATTTKPVSGNWIPQDITDWRTETVDLSQFRHDVNMMVRIETANGQGNNLYLDNINVFTDNNPNGIAEANRPKFVMYPNPVTDGILNFSTAISGNIYSIAGVQMVTFVNTKSVDVSKLPKGVYMVSSTENNQVYKLVIQ